jgi:anti-anti-sigma factor
VTVFLEERTRFSVLEVEGTLQAPVSATLRQSVDTLLSRGERTILLNLARVPAIDAAGIGELLRVYHTTVEAGGALRVTSANPRVRRLLDVVGVFRLLSAQGDWRRSDL